MHACSPRSRAAPRASRVAAPARDEDRAAWPAHCVLGDGSDVGVVGVYRFDVNDFADDTLPDGKPAFADSHASGRKELGLTLRKKGSAAGR